MTTGYDNTLIGSEAGSAITNSYETTIIGKHAGLGVTSGPRSVIIGFEAGVTLTTQGYNCFIGNKSGNKHIGQYNTAVGQFTLNSGAYPTTSGNFNLVVGYSAASAGISGDRNTAIGPYAIQSQTPTGNNNTFIGHQAAGSSSSVSNEITLGNSSVTALRCAVTSITSLSDERDKAEIEDLSYGLAFIDALQPREFVWDNRPETTTEVDEDGNETEVEFYSSNKGKKDFGFIAQEVKELDNNTLRLVYDENPDKLELSYGKLVPILVKAIQELKEEVEILKSQNN